MLWQYGPMLVFGNDSLAGLTSLTQLYAVFFAQSSTMRGLIHI